MSFTPRDNPSFVLRAANDTFFEDRAIHPVGDYDVLVEVAKTGICGSDIHYYDHGGSGAFQLEDPMILGHESSGVVVQTGSKIDPTLLGQRVALEPGEGCFNCITCRAGQYHLCEQMQFAATPPFTRGTLTRYYTLKAFLAHPIPDQLSLEDASLIEPLSVAVHSVLGIGEAKAGYNHVVFGAGPVGLLCMAVMRASGANRVIAVDLNEKRLEFAKSYVGAETWLPPKTQDGETRSDYTFRAAKELKAYFNIPHRGQGGIDLVTDCTGAEVCIQIGLHVARDRGVFLQVGNGAPMITIPLLAMVPREVSIKTSFRYGAGDYETAIPLVSQGKVQLSPLVSHQYPFTDAAKAIQDVKKGVGHDGKPVIKAIINGPE